MSRLTGPPADVEYPSGDGQPMAESGVHVRTLLWLYQALEDFHADQPDAFFAVNMFWYWRQGDPTAVVAPDVMVLPGIGDRGRQSLRSWEHGGAVPALVIEASSKTTLKEDLGKKFKQYERLGVHEYFLFDPEGLSLVPVLQGFRLVGGRYERLWSDDRRLDSDLGLSLQPEGEMLRLIDRGTGRHIPTRREQASVAARQAESAERQAEDARRQAVEARQQADDARRQVAAADQRAEAAEQRAAALAAELARLRASPGNP